MRKINLKPKIMLFHFSAKFEDDIFDDMGYHGEIEFPIQNPENISKFKNAIIKKIKVELSRKIKKWKKDAKKLIKIEVYYHENDLEKMLYLWQKM